MRRTSPQNTFNTPTLRRSRIKDQAVLPSQQQESKSGSSPGQGSPTLDTLAVSTAEWVLGAAQDPDDVVIWWGAKKSESCDWWLKHNDLCKCSGIEGCERGHAWADYKTIGLWTQTCKKPSITATTTYTPPEKAPTLPVCDPFGSPFCIVVILQPVTVFIFPPSLWLLHMRKKFGHVTPLWPRFV